MNEPLLKLNGVSFSYDGKQVLRNVSLELKCGEIVGLAGPNGAGKTTLLKLMIGLLRPDRGRVEFTGRAGARSIGYLSQHAQRIDANFPATVRDIVSTGLYGKIGVLGRLGASDKDTVESAVRAVGLGRLGEERITELSGGQMQRAFIARALVSNPSLLILDEPTTGVDLSGEEEFYKLITRLNKRYGMAVMLVSHDIYALVEHTDRIIFLNKEVLYDEKPSGLSSGKLLKMLFYHKHPKGTVERLEKGMRLKMAGAQEGGK
ncbi:putative ABC transporter ATP-binding protein [uncultured archaeon]|nr:putative ABC transporter ATP-binding protein [uncultured archaeon]